jgi:hypothetical protein
MFGSDESSRGPHAASTIGCGAQPQAAETNLFHVSVLVCPHAASLDFRPVNPYEFPYIVGQPPVVDEVRGS